MNPAEKAAVIEKANERRYAISEQKGGEYSGKKDVLRNFKQQGDRLDLESIKVLGVYFGKHIDSIESFMRALPKCKTYAAKVALVNNGEGLVSRLDDARNYLDLLECLLHDLELHPDKLDREAVARHDMMELAESIDWSAPGWKLKNERTEELDAFSPSVEAGELVGPASYVTEGNVFPWRREWWRTHIYRAGE